MQDPTYMCPQCSTRASGILVPVAIRAEHEKMHETRRQPVTFTNSDGTTTSSYIELSR